MRTESLVSLYLNIIGYIAILVALIRLTYITFQVIVREVPKKDKVKHPILAEVALCLFFATWGYVAVGINKEMEFDLGLIPLALFFLFVHQGCVNGLKSLFTPDRK